MFRLVTPLGLARTVTEDDEYRGYYIPKGTTILPNVWCVSRCSAQRHAVRAHTYIFFQGCHTLCLIGCPLTRGYLDGHSYVGFTVRNGQLYTPDGLVVPGVGTLRKDLSASHEAPWGISAPINLRGAYHWSHMRTELEHAYIAGCADC